ncbi:MAG: outer membrane beta-barrel domain-containing protein [Solimonas sp.]
MNESFRTSLLRGSKMAIAGLSLSGLAGCALFAGPENDQRTLPGEEASGQVIDPDVQRPRVAVKGIKPQEFEVGAYAGLMHTESVRALGYYGLRATYNPSDLLFVEAHYLTASTFLFNDLRHLVGRNDAPDVSYDSYGLDLGVNLVPGELYFGPRYTVPFTVYALVGGGRGDWEGDRFGVIRYAGGVRFFPLERWSVRLEAGDDYWARDGGQYNLQINLGIGFNF